MNRNTPGKSALRTRKWLALASSIGALAFSPSVVKAQTKVTFPASGTYTVPAGVSTVVVKAWGAGGSSGATESATRATGGAGGYVFGQLAVTPGETLNVVVGGAGALLNGGASTIGAGGSSTSTGANFPSAGGGGGASGVTRGATVLVAAGGGGGGGGTNTAAAPGDGGAGGGATGVTGGAGSGGAGAGGTQAAGGAGGASSGGNAGLPGTGPSPNGTGGAGAVGGGQSAAGGGGGGGYTGGGGGSASSNASDDASGGGGGASFIGGMTNASTTPGSGTVPGNNGDVDYLAGRALGGTTAGGGAGYVVIIVPPGVGTQTATNITFSSADLGAQINPNGNSTTAWFEWGTDSTLTVNSLTTVTSLGSGTSAVALNATISPLAAHTTYYYRAAALASGVTVYGPIQSFTTPNNSPSVTRAIASLIVNEGTATANNGTFGDLDGDPVTLTATVGGNPVGTITPGAGTWSWSYTPPDGPAADTVTITANDGFGGTATATFSLTVNDVAPSISATGAANVNEGSLYTLNLGSVVDPGTDTVSGYSIDWGDGSAPTSGAGVPPSTDTHTYANGPSGGVLRSITVSLTNEDGSFPSAGSTSVTVDNVAPTATPQTVNLVEDAAITAITLGATDPGTLDTLTYSVVTGLSDGAAGTLGSPSGNSINFTPAADFNGSVTFTFKATDNDSADSNTATVTINVSEVNDAPTGTDDPISDSIEDAPRSLTFASLLGNDIKGPANESSQTLTIISVTAGTGGTPAINGSSIDFTPTPDYFGPASFTYTLQDNGTTNGAADPKTSTAVVSFTITPVNDIPVGGPDALSSIAEDSSTRVMSFASLTGNDSAGPANENTQTLTITAVSAPTGGTVVINGTDVEFTPTAEYFGPAGFTYTVRDNGQSGSPLADDFQSTDVVVTFDITPVNDAPTASSSTTGEIAEDNSFSIPFAALIFLGSPGPANESSQTLTVTGVGNASGCSVSIVGPNVVVSPLADYFGPASFDYTLQDNGQTGSPPVDDFKSATGTISFTYTPVNDAPVGTNDPLSSSDEDNMRVISFTTLTGNDSTGPANENTQSPTITAVSAPTGGTVAINGSNVEFTPTPDYNGPAGFTYTLQDNGESGNPPTNDFKTSTASVTFTLDAVNDAPVITSNGGLATAGVSIPENGTAVTTVTATDVEITQNELPAQSLTFSKAGGSDEAKFNLNPTTGVLTFIDPPNFELPTDSDTNNTYIVIVRVTDNGSPNLFVEQTITVTITDILNDDGPIPVPSAVGDVVTANDAPNRLGGSDGTKFDLLRRGGFTSENGNLVFPGNLLIGAGGVILSPNNFMGVWKEGGSGVKLLARSGDDPANAAPGTGGAYFDVLPQVPAINDSGEVSILASLTVGSGLPVTTVDNDTGIWSEIGGGGLQLLIREGDVVPGLGTLTVGAFASGAYATAHTGAATGEAAFPVTLKNGADLTDSVILRASIVPPAMPPGPSSVAIGIVARENSPAPGTGENFGGLASSYTDALRMDATGNLTFAAVTRPSSRESLWYQPISGAVSKVFIAGDTAPDTSDGMTSATFKNIKSPAIGSGGVVTFRGLLNSNGDNAGNLKNDGIWRGTGGDPNSYHCILRRGDTGLPGMPLAPPLPAQPAKVGNLWHSWLTNANHGAWKGWLDLDGNGSSSTTAGDVNAIYTDLSGTMKLAVKVGDAAPGIVGTTLSTFDLPVVGGAEQMAFIGKITGPGVTAANNQGIWRSAPNGGALSLVIRTGDTMTTTQGIKTIKSVDFPGSNTTDRRWEQPVMDSTGRLIIYVTFVGGSTSQVIAP